jgi:hypothetical protein
MSQVSKSCTGAEARSHLKGLADLNPGLHVPGHDRVGVLVAGTDVDFRGLRLEEVSAMIVSSVVPGLARSYRDLVGEAFNVPFYPVDEGMETGLKNRYDDPGAVGADRIVNAVAAGRYYGFPGKDLRTIKSWLLRACANRKADSDVEAPKPQDVPK